MAKSTLLEFAEAAQFDKSRKQIENNESEGLLRMVAVLLRENGEEYNEFVFEKNMVDFLQLPLQVAYEVSFLFHIFSVISNSFCNSSAKICCCFLVFISFFLILKYMNVNLVVLVKLRGESHPPLTMLYSAWFELGFS